MNINLRMLIDLQKTISRIEYLERFTSDGPSILEGIDKDIKEEEEAFQNKKDTFETIQKEKREQEGNLQLLQSKLEKYKDQSMAVKSNKEYQAILQEIALCEKEIEKAEEDVIVKMYEIDKLEGELTKDEEEHLKTKKTLEEKRKTTEQELADSEKELEKLKVNKEDLEKSLPEDVLEEFNNILSIRDGVAIALAKDGICQACKIRIRPQVYLEVKKGDEILSCDNCDRYLYREDMLNKGKEPADGENEASTTQL